MNVRIFILSGALLGCILSGVSASENQHVPDTQWTYKIVDGKALKMDVFLPEGYDSNDDFPVFVVFHGGSWEAGEPSWHYPDCAYWSSRGMVAVSVDYRLKTRDQIEVPLECVKDAKSAIRFLRKNAGKLKINPDALVAAGDSAGGQIAAAVAMIDAANDDYYDRTISCMPNAVILYNPYFKCRPDLSPPNFIKGGLPPMITFLGDRDPAITVKELNRFHESLKIAGNDSEYYVGKGGVHGFCNGRNPMNPFFYWSLELEDRFLVKHGILSGDPQVRRPPGVGQAEMADPEAVRKVTAEVSKDFAELDRDESGFVSLEEYIEQSSDVAHLPGPLLGRGQEQAFYTRKFQDLDRNQDGVLTPGEV